MIRKYIVLILIFIFPCSLFTACRDASEVDDNVYAVSIGLDKGIDNKAIITIQYPIYGTQTSGQGGGGGGGGQAGLGGTTNIHSVEAPSLLEAVDLMNMAISRRVSLLHTKMLVISEDYARDGVENTLSSFAKFRGTRRTMFVIISKGSAKEFIEENRTNIGGSITKAVELMLSQSKNTGFFPFVNFHEFYRNILSPYGEAIAIYAGVNDLKKLQGGFYKTNPPLITQRDIEPGEMPREGTAKREFVGTALFKGDKMVGSLNPYETRYMLMLTNKFEQGILTIEDKKVPNNGIILSIRLGRPTKISGRFVDGNPEIDVDINIEADISAVHSRINYENLNKVEDLNKQLKEEIKEGVMKTIDKSKKEYRTDVFEFGKKFAGYFSTIDEWEKYNWPSHFPEAKVNVDVEVNVRRTGLTIDSSPIKVEDSLE